MQRSLVTRAIDALMWPQISTFAFETALKMSRTEFIRGARAAGHCLHGAYRAAIGEGDSAQLHAMLQDDMIAPSLHDMLASECRRGCDAGPSTVDLMLATLERQSQQLEGSAAVRSLKLIGGARRDDEAVTSRMPAMHRLDVGSHLVVIDDQPDGLWKVARQRELLLRRGCCVQVEVAFGDPAASEQQVLLLEACVEGEALVARSSSDDALSVRVADLNGMTGGSFWSAASRVRPWWELGG